MTAREENATIQTKDKNIHVYETFEKCSISIKVKPPARKAYAPEQAPRLAKRGRFAKVSYIGTFEASGNKTLTEFEPYG